MGAPLNNSNHYKHGMRETRLYNIWRSMRQRCNNPKTRNYKNYGGRGIRVCNEWEDFQTFVKWAFQSGYNDTLTIDRENTDGNYCPENCRWTTYKKQNNNRRDNRLIEYNGEIHTLSEWSDIIGIKMPTLWKRIKDGWSIEKAFTSPLKINQFC